MLSCRENILEEKMHFHRISHGQTLSLEILGFRYNKLNLSDPSARG